MSYFTFIQITIKILGVNPFAKLPRSLSENGKMIGPKEMFCSCFELSEGMGNITSHYSSNSVSTPDSSSDAGQTPKVSHEEDLPPAIQRRAISLVHPPSISSIIHSLEPIHDADNIKDNK